MLGAKRHGRKADSNSTKHKKLKSKLLQNLGADDNMTTFSCIAQETGRWQRRTTYGDGSTAQNYIHYLVDHNRKDLGRYYQKISPSTQFKSETNNGSKIIISFKKPCILSGTILKSHLTIVNYYKNKKSNKPTNKKLAQHMHHSIIYKKEKERILDLKIYFTYKHDGKHEDNFSIFIKDGINNKKITDVLSSEEIENFKKISYSCMMPIIELVKKNIDLFENKREKLVNNMEAENVSEEDLDEEKKEALTDKEKLEKSIELRENWCRLIKSKEYQIYITMFRNAGYNVKKKNNSKKNKKIKIKNFFIEESHGKGVTQSREEMVYVSIFAQQLIFLKSKLKKLEAFENKKIGNKASVKKATKSTTNKGKENKSHTSTKTKINPNLKKRQHPRSLQAKKINFFEKELELNIKQVRGFTSACHRLMDALTNDQDVTFTQLLNNQMKSVSTKFWCWIDESFINELCKIENKVFLEIFLKHQNKGNVITRSQDSEVDRLVLIILKLIKWHNADGMIILYNLKIDIDKILCQRTHQSLPHHISGSIHTSNEEEIVAKGFIKLMENNVKLYNLNFIARLDCDKKYVKANALQCAILNGQYILATIFLQYDMCDSFFKIFTGENLTEMKGIQFLAQILMMCGDGFSVNSDSHKIEKYLFFSILINSPTQEKQDMLVFLREIIHFVFFRRNSKENQSPALMYKAVFFFSMVKIFIFYEICRSALHPKKNLDEHINTACLKSFYTRIVEIESDIDLPKASKESKELKEKITSTDELYLNILSYLFAIFHAGWFYDKDIDFLRKKFPHQNSKESSKRYLKEYLTTQLSKYNKTKNKDRAYMQESNTCYTRAHVSQKIIYYFLKLNDGLDKSEIVEKMAEFGSHPLYGYDFIKDCQQNPFGKNLFAKEWEISIMDVGDSSQKKTLKKMTVDLPDIYRKALKSMVKLHEWRYRHNRKSYR